MANGVALEKGDVLAGVGSGVIKHFDSTGKLLDEINNERGTQFVTGMCFDSSSNLYATNFFGGMTKFDQEGNVLVSEFGEKFNEDPESCAVDSANNIYDGQADGSGEVLKFDTSGKLLASFAPEREDRGTDWVDLAADGCTLHYTSEGSAIKAFNVCTNEQLAAAATELPGPCYAHRIVSDGSELVACSSVVEHVNASGEIIKTYEPGGTGNLFALNLDPDGTTFWTGDLFSGEVWRINIATGEVVTTFNTGINTALGGLTIVGEITQTPRITLSPVTAENVVGTEHTVTATVTEEGKPASGVKVSFTVSGANPQTGEATTNASGEATFTYKGESTGTDTIVATFVDKTDKTHESNTATKVWQPEGEPPKETKIATSLSGGGQSGTTITVPEKTAVTDGATLSGDNAPSATGKVTYKVYSDSECTTEVASGGEVEVTAGTVPASSAVTLTAPGTYYWQASYGGDSKNAPSKSECGSEVEIVTKVGCTKVAGLGYFGEGPELAKVKNSLSTNLAAAGQKFAFAWEHGRKKFVMKELEGATCTISKRGLKTFRGHGEGTLNLAPEYVASFVFKINAEEETFFRVTIRNEKTKAIVAAFELQELEESTEVIS